MTPLLGAAPSEEASPEQKIAAVHDFVGRCRSYAVTEISRRRESGKATEEWEIYLRFTDVTLRELGDGTLDTWFAPAGRG